jgi:hypothetical protein
MRLAVINYHFDSFIVASAPHDVIAHWTKQNSISLLTTYGIPFTLEEPTIEE